MYQYTTEQINRLNARIKKTDNPDDCWEWQGCLVGHMGYGQISLRANKAEKRMYTHRMTWELANGEVPEGLFVLHTCDNPKCCNLSHLFLGTNQDNIDDKMAKGRYRSLKGADHKMAKLSVEDVKKILTRYEYGSTGANGSVALGREFGVHPAQILKIVGGKNWKSIER